MDKEIIIKLLTSASIDDRILGFEYFGELEISEMFSIIPKNVIGFPEEEFRDPFFDKKLVLIIDEKNTFFFIGCVFHTNVSVSEKIDIWKNAGYIIKYHRSYESRNNT